MPMELDGRVFGAEHEAFRRTVHKTTIRPEDIEPMLNRLALLTQDKEQQ